MIILAGPLAFDLDSLLWCRMTNAGIDTRQRTLPNFGQHSQVDAGFFVGRRVGHVVHVAAGESVHRAFNRVHRHVQFVALYPVRHQRSNADLTVAGDQLHPGPALNSALFGEFGRDLDKGVGCLLANPFAAVSKVAFVKVFEQPTVVQMQVVLRIGYIGGADPGQGK
jgi:hypothetical protein